MELINIGNNVRQNYKNVLIPKTNSFEYQSKTRAFVLLLLYYYRMNNSFKRLILQGDIRTFFTS